MVNEQSTIASTQGRWLTALVVTLALAACAQQEFLSDQPDYPCARQVKDQRACINAFSNLVHVRRVKVGQTPTEVRQTVGKDPEARETISPEVEAWLYHTDYANKTWTRITFKQGKVVESPARVSEVNKFINDPQSTESRTWTRLRELKLLFDKGAITKDEYEEKRKAILRDL